MHSRDCRAVIPPVVLRSRGRPNLVIITITEVTRGSCRQQHHLAFVFLHRSIAIRRLQRCLRRHRRRLRRRDVMR